MFPFPPTLCLFTAMYDPGFPPAVNRELTLWPRGGECPDATLEDPHCVGVIEADDRLLEVGSEQREVHELGDASTAQSG